MKCIHGVSLRKQCNRCTEENAHLIKHTPRRRASGEYECTCGAVWDADEGKDCPNAS